VSEGLAKLSIGARQGHWGPDHHSCGKGGSTHLHRSGGVFILTEEADVELNSMVGEDVLELG
jgi:hypothetical protein